MTVQLLSLLGVVTLTVTIIPGVRNTVSDRYPAAAPVITSLSPANALVGSGPLTLSIRGTSFKQNATVRWNDNDNPGVTYEYVSEQEITLNLSAALTAVAGRGLVTVFVPGGQGGVSNPMAFEIRNPVPTVTGTVPQARVMAGGEPFNLTVRGSRFIPRGARIIWDRTSYQASSGSATALQATIPASALVPGTVRIAVVNPTPTAGPSNAVLLDVVHLTPSITELTPATRTSGTGAFTLKLAGQNFIRSTSRVAWNGSPRETRYVSPAALEADIKAEDVFGPGRADVTVTTALGGSEQTSAAKVFTSALPTSDVVAVTVPPPIITTFYVGGSGNPQRVWANQAIPLHAVRSGTAPTHWRASSSADFTGATWQTIGTALSHTFPASQAGPQTLHFQYRYSGGLINLESARATDDVVVRRPWFALVPVVFGEVTSDHRLLNCAAGEVVTGIRSREDADGNVQALGINCRGTARSMVGGSLSGTETSWQCSNGEVVASIAVWHGKLQPTPGAGGMVSLIHAGKLFRRETTCAPNSSVREGRFDQLYAIAVPGTVSRRDDLNSTAGVVGCPSGGFPTGVDLYFSGTYLKAVGMRCARPD